MQKKVNDNCHSLGINPSTSNVGFTPVPRYLSYMYFSQSQAFFSFYPSMVISITKIPVIENQ